MMLSAPPRFFLRERPRSRNNGFNTSWRYIRVAALRGRVGRALALADSITAFDEPPASRVITLALVDPGHEGAARDAARYLDRLADTTRQAQVEAASLCYAELWRVSQGDTSSTRRAVERIRRAVQKLDPAPFPRVGRLQVCPLLLEAAMEWTASRPERSPALDRLEALMRQGTGLELPGNVANLMIARWREAQVNYQSALAAVRRRLGGMQNTHFTLITTAYLREEGRLAALVGDTAAAVRAYSHYLTLRDDPDPGPMEEEVRRVKAHLAELGGVEGAGTPRVPRVAAASWWTGR